MKTRFLSLFSLVLLTAGCDGLLPGAPASESVLAEPLADLTEAQLASHLVGDEEFARVFSPADGLGPLFVATSCEACHIGDGKGHPVTTLTRFGRQTVTGFDPMPAHGGPQLQHRSIAGYPAEVLPDGVTGVTQLMPPAVTGLGFLEAIEDSTLLALADPTDADGDGISGVPNWVVPPDFLDLPPERILQAGRAIGRFGKKAGTINLVHQTVNAYREDMGITSDFDPVDLHNTANGTFTGDTVADPEVSSDAVRNVVFYIRTLKAPPRRTPDAPAIKAGELLFEQIGCAGCHTPTLTTGPSDIAGLSRKTIYPYTDLLMHDMGPELDDGYTEGTATTSEWRTAPLWGLGLAQDSQGGQAFYLHDGRATTLREAIRFHGGEGAASRKAFDDLSRTDQENLLTFLTSL